MQIRSILCIQTPNLLSLLSFIRFIYDGDAIIQDLVKLWHKSILFTRAYPRFLLK